VIDSASLFLGLFARLAGMRQDRIRRFSESLEVEVAEKTESLRMALDEARKANETIVHIADHDALTGLLNRRRFQKELMQWAAYALRYERALALIFIDLDNFKFINDTYGHHIGDQYLVTIADALRRTFRATDHLARWGGDEFAILLPETQAAQAMEVANKLLRQFNETKMHFDQGELSVSASIGIALFPVHTSDPNQLLAFADAAMYEAKQAGRNCWRMYAASPQEMERVQEHIRWEGRIRRALETDQFVLVYQPLLDLETQETHNYEALLRLEDRDGELISPRLFLDTAEQFDLSVAIDRMVIRKATRKIETLAASEKGLGLSLNLSRKMINDPGFIQYVEENVRETGIRPQALSFEIGEQLALENLGTTRALATQLKELGHRLILDDFGLGFSSFHYLQQLAVHMVKVEGGLIRDIATNRDNRRFLKTLVAMAHDLDIKVAAKFVEDADILDVLRDLGVDYAQGFAIGRPLESIEQTLLIARSA
jgi:diguanylate cyclase (GGDEF)-like protein